jgi:rare lipoprotein A
LKKVVFVLGGGVLAAVLTAIPLAGAHDNQCGRASWYALAGNQTASGEVMNPDALTAAHRTLPFGTRVRIINQQNGRELVVTINDRGPFIRSRIIDVSRAAAHQLGFRNAGTASVCLTQV